MRNLETASASTESVEEQIAKVLPKEMAGYFEDTEKKHFDSATAIGSLFTEVKTLEGLLVKAIEQRGNLDDDDRKQFIAMGVPPDAMLGFCRYIKVNTPGETGIRSIKDFPPETKVKVIRAKRGTPCSLVVETDNLPWVDFGTIIIGPNERSEMAKPEDPMPSTKEMIWTVHPGLPVRPAEKDFWMEGTEITVKDILAKLGDDVFLNVKKLS